MLSLERKKTISLAAFVAIPMIFLLIMMSSLAQLGASPMEAKQANLIDWNSTNSDHTQITDIAEKATTKNLASSDNVPSDNVYKTFTPSDYSLADINAALASCPEGKTVKLDKGTYQLDGIVHVPAGRTLSGSMDSSGNITTVITTSLSGEALRMNGCIDIGSGGNTVKSIKTLNGYFFSGTNSHDFLMQDCQYNGPADSSAGQYNLYGFFIYMGVNGNYDNGHFERCVANNAPTFGFLVAADGSKSSNRIGPNAYSAHNWTWTGCVANDCGLANMNYPGQFVYGCGYDFFEGFGSADPIVGMRVTDSVANGNAADGFHVEYMMDVVDFVFKNSTANDNGQWFKTGHTSDPYDGVLIGTGFYLGGKQTSQTKVDNVKADNNWGFSTQGGGAGIINSQQQTDKTGHYSQGQGADKSLLKNYDNKK